MAKGDMVHRVVRMPGPMQEAMPQARDAQGRTNAIFVARAVADHLPRLIEGSHSLGYGKLPGQRRSARLPSQK
jgi:hypothetical protein